MSSQKKNSIPLSFFMLALACGLALPFPVWPCGRWFSNRILVGGDKGVLWMPLTTFDIEIAKIKSRKTPPFKAKPLENGRYGYVTKGQYHNDALRKDLEDLREALQDQKLSERDQDRIFQQYKIARTAINHYACSQEARTYFHCLYRKQNVICQDVLEAFYVPCLLPKPNQDQYQLTHMKDFIDQNCPELEEFSTPDPNREVPPETPGEFALYLRGASLYYQNQWPEAQDYWRKILDLPPDQRRRKSTWAAFMLGKTLFESDPDQSLLWFRKVRKLARSGYRDPLGLAAETYLWEAKAAYDKKNYLEAMELLITARATGYDNGKAYLRLCCRNIVAGGPKAMAAAARDPTARQVLSAFFSSYYNSDTDPGGKKVEPWLRAVERSQARDVVTTDLLAWTAYENGRMDLCRRWLNRGPNNTALSLWLRAKLQMRDGNLSEAERLLKKASRKFPPGQKWAGTSWLIYNINGLEHSGIVADKRVLAELGAVQLKLGSFVKALDSFLRASEINYPQAYWLDAVYLAERVLTVEELKKYVDRNWADPGLLPDPWADIVHKEKRDWGAAFTAEKIRYVLARRLTRLGRWQEARAYYPEKIRPLLDSYIQAIQRGNDESLSREDRIRAFWQAGDVARHDGQALMEIEIETDWMRINHGYELDKTSRVRLPPGPRQILGAAASERRRVEKHIEEAGSHFHYYYVALEHYRSAVSMMPDDNDETARRICEAGRWMRYFDPQAADFFYKAMVWRCWSRPLAREADIKRWFPQCDEGKKEP